MSRSHLTISRGVAHKRAASTIAGLTFLLMATTAAIAAPAIRTSETNRVPQCVTPDRLMAFVHDRNPTVDPRYREIAGWYKKFGEAWHVRWDYAFYQMILETNALKYRRGNGQRGDVREKQNNFAGIGATGHGAPGERFTDIKTGVHAQIQHLVAYSGERLADPIAARTQLVQDSVIDQSRKLRRPVTFGDLARRWAADRGYAKSIDTVAEQFRSAYCTGVEAKAAAPIGVPAPRPATRRALAEFSPPSGLGGPKPQMLAGPDDLPWTGTSGQQAAVTAQQIDENTAPAATEPSDARPSENNDAQLKSHKVPPVRTIWSRDGNIPGAVAVPKPAQPKAEHQAERVVAPAIPGKAPSPAQAPPIAVVRPEQAADDAPLLPHFKIGPATPAPSRLGGPVDAIGLAAPAASPPSARFKEIVVPEPQAAGPTGAACRVLAASYGGTKTLLVRAVAGGETRYTALTVLDGFEKSMFDIYSTASAPGAELVGEYPNKDEALADARANCPGG